MLNMRSSSQKKPNKFRPFIACALLAAATITLGACTEAEIEHNWHALKTEVSNNMPHGYYNEKDNYVDPHKDKKATVDHYKSAYDYDEDYDYDAMVYNDENDVNARMATGASKTSVSYSEDYKAPYKEMPYTVSFDDKNSADDYTSKEIKAPSDGSPLPLFQR